MSSGRAKLYRGATEKKRLAQRLERRIEKQRRRVRVLEGRHEELLAENRKLKRKADRVHELEARITELEGGYRLDAVSDGNGQTCLEIRRGLVEVWSSRYYNVVKPRHMRRASRVLAAFERSE